jgi:Domain of unknown function (DUF4376)
MVMAALTALSNASSMGFYNPRAWYWQVGTQIYASVSNTYVPASDPGYVTWAENNAAVVVADEVELWGIVGNAISEMPRWLFYEGEFVQPTVGAYSKCNLGGYTVYVREARIGGGIVVNGKPFATDPVTLMSLNAAYIYTQNTPGATFQWKLPDGSFLTLNKADVQTLQACVSQDGQLCYDCESSTLAAIEAGTITTLAQIDAAFAALSNVYTGLTELATQRRFKLRRK